MVLETLSLIVSVKMDSGKWERNLDVPQIRLFLKPQIRS